ncbi:MAG: transposase [Methylococcaceae bacterium]|nr:transposase [Methylococcaceae bacterium]
MPKPTAPHSCDLRKGRVSEAHRAYLITSVCAGRKPWFADSYLGRLLVRVFMGVRPDAETLAFVVMPDHFHWLMQLGGERDLSDVVQAVKSVSSHRINQHLGRKGFIWQEGCHDHALRSDEDLPQLARYVVANPLRAGLVSRLGDYPLWDAIGL